MSVLSKKFPIGVAFAAGLLVAAFIAMLLMPRNSNAQVACTVDNNLLTKLYDTVFHRPLDAGAIGYEGRDVNFVLDQLKGAQEHKMYTAIFKSVKALEEAQRETGELSTGNSNLYLDIVDSAISQVNQWAKTLPEHATAADKVVGPEHARTAIQDAYDSLNATAQQAAHFGIFQAQKNLGVPSSLPLPGTADTTAPTGITDLAASVPTYSSIALTWTAPGDDGGTGTATSYDIRYSTASITDTNWASATQVTGESSPLVSGSSQSMTVSGLTSGTTYHFAMKTSDEIPNKSALSNVVSLSTNALPSSGGGGGGGGGGY